MSRLGRGSPIVGAGQPVDFGVLVLSAEYDEQLGFVRADSVEQVGVNQASRNQPDPAMWS